MRRNTRRCEIHDAKPKSGCVSRLAVTAECCKNACTRPGHPRRRDAVRYAFEPSQHLRYLRVFSHDNLLHVIPAETVWPFCAAALLCKKVRNCDGFGIP